MDDPATKVKADVITKWSTKRRAEPIFPVQKKLRYNDGTPMRTKVVTDKFRSMISRLKDVYTFTPLGPNEDIRVLILEKGKGSAPIVCRLLPCALPGGDTSAHNVPEIPYEALSYYWGQDVDATESITINRPSMEHIDEKKWWIRPNLYAALVELRAPDREVRLWVDAICIEQANEVEKNAQVARMHEIYSKATSVCIWLGVGDLKRNGMVDHESTKTTFEFIRDIIIQGGLDELVSKPVYAKGWNSFVDLMKNRWFSRRWVIQELVLAKEATVHYGHEVMQWSDFADAVALFVTKHDEINKLLKEHSATVGLEPISDVRNLRARAATELDPIGDMRGLGAHVLVEAINNLFRRSDGGKITGRLMTLEKLVSKMLPFEATNPKDTIYAVLSVASDTPYADNENISLETLVDKIDKRIFPDYTKTEAQVFTDFIDYAIEKSGSLDIICRHWAPAPRGRRRNTATTDPDAHGSMPTWVPVITGSAFGGPEVVLYGRCNADSLVGVPHHEYQQHYSATRALKPHHKVVRYPGNETSQDAGALNGTSSIANSQGGHTGGGVQRSDKTFGLGGQNIVLKVRGICLDVISKLSPRVADGYILQESLELGGWNPNKWNDESKPEKVPEALWRTLVADRTPEGTNAYGWYQRQCQTWFANLTQNGMLSITALMDKPKTDSNLVKFLKRVQEVVWNRKFLRTRGGKEEKVEEQLFGLAPTSAQEGDLVCLLFGCTVPVILREKRTAAGKYYNFVGEAYIHGIMDGEMISKSSPPVFPYGEYPEFQIR